MKKVFNYLLAIATFLSLILYVIFVRDAEFTLFPLITDYGNLIIRGLSNTLYVSLIALLGSLVLGFILYLLSISRLLCAKHTAHMGLNSLVTCVFHLFHFLLEKYPCSNLVPPLHTPISQSLEWK